MSRIVHGHSHKALKHFRKCPAALSVYWVYIARANIDNVAWPSIRGLAEDTGWSRTECHKARLWLVECNAIKEDTDYIRPMWRHLPAQKLAQKRNFDRAKYYRPTGFIEPSGDPLRLYFDLLYAPENREADPHVDTDESADVLQGSTSDACTTGLDIQQGGTELNTIEENELDSTSSDPNGSDAVIKPCTICGIAGLYWNYGEHRCQEHFSNVRLALDEIIPDPPKPKRKRSEKQLALDGMKNSLADAFGFDHTQVTATTWNAFGKAGKELLEVGATPDDMKPLHAWCKSLGWINFSCVAMSKEYANYAKSKTPDTPQASTTTAHETRVQLGLVDG